MQGTFRGYEGNVQGICRERSGDICSKLSGENQGSLRGYAGNFQGICKERLGGDSHGTFMGYTGNVQEICRQFTRCASAAPLVVCAGSPYTPTLHVVPDSGIQEVTNRISDTYNLLHVCDEWNVRHGECALLVCSEEDVRYLEHTHPKHTVDSTW
jgi:hypothetical protein